MTSRGITKDRLLTVIFSRKIYFYVPNYRASKDTEKNCHNEREIGNFSIIVGHINTIFLADDKIRPKKQNKKNQ